VAVHAGQMRGHPFPAWDRCRTAGGWSGAAVAGTCPAAE
jgi:hypothetical protein